MKHLAAVLAAGFMAAGLLAFPAAAARNVTTVTCSLSEDTAGNLVAAVTGAAPATDYGFYVYAPLPDGSSPAVVNGGFTTDPTGSHTFVVYSVTYLMTRYPGETYLVFTIYPMNRYPQHGNRDGALTSCSFTP